MVLEIILEAIFIVLIGGGATLLVKYAKVFS